MKKQITSLFEYEMWANGIILDSLSQLEETDEKSLDIMAHILLTEMVWYSRISGIAEPLVWAKKSLEQCKDIYSVNNKILTTFIDKQTKDTLEASIEYKNSKGNKYNNTVTEILTHLFNHSTYHRGQIIERMKGKLSAMPVTDYIAFMRLKALK